MNIFDELGRIYGEIDSTYAPIESEARKRRHTRKESEYYGKRQLNNQAYFLFMFTRMEDHIKELSNTLIDTKVGTITEWKSKRTWEILAKRKDRMPLMDRVALLTEINAMDYNIIDRYYRQRNSIAHGGTFTVTIDIPTVIADMKRLFRDLEQ
jgi:hypothetical protein